MKKISLVNGKGGVGKTLLSVLLAANLHKHGYGVSLYDADPQGSASTKAGLFEIPMGENGEKFVIYDTMPSLKFWKESGVEKIIADSDLVLIVLTPSPDDLLLTAESCNIVKAIRDHSKTTRLVFNSVYTNSRVAKHRISISDGFGFPTLQNFVSRRQAYQNAGVGGWGELTVEAREEINNLTLEVLSAL